VSMKTIMEKCIDRMTKLLNRLGITGKQSFFVFVKQFFKFCLIGVSNTLVHLGVYFVLVHFSVHYLIANAIAFTVSVGNAYLWNRLFVFSLDSGNGLRAFFKTFTVYFFSTFLFGSVLLFVFVDILHISQQIAPLINIAIVTPINFLLNKFWAFK